MANAFTSQASTEDVNVFQPSSDECLVEVDANPTELQVDEFINDLDHGSTTMSANRYFEHLVSELQALKEPLSQLSPGPSSAPAMDNPMRSATPRLAPDICCVTDQVIRRVMNKDGALPLKGTHLYSISDVTYGKVDMDCKSQREIAAMRALVREFRDIFGTEALPPLCKADPVSLQLNTSYQSRTSMPHFKPNWSPTEVSYLQQVRAQLESFDAVEPVSETNVVTHICNLTVVLKDGGDKLRVCYDGRLMKGRIILPRVQYTLIPDMVERASSTDFYKSCFDFQSAYMQKGVAKESRKYLGVYLPDEQGRPKLYRYTRMIWGLSASAAFMVQHTQECVSSLPADMQTRVAYYVDDIAITSPTFDQHLKDIRSFFTMCRQRGMTLHPKKAHIFCGGDFKFLGYNCGRGSTSMADDNVEAIRRMPAPTKRSDVRHVMGVLNTARHYVRDYAAIVKPIQDLASERSIFMWGPKQKAAFKAVKEAIMNRVKLYRFDPTQHLVLHCDASQYAGGCWLTQHQSGSENMNTIAFFSKKLTPAEQVMSAFAREALILLWSLQKCRPYIQSSPHITLVYTDAHSLQYVQASTRSALSSRLLAKVADLRFEIRHIPGVDNVVADALSRFRMASPHELLGHDQLEALKEILRFLPPSLQLEKSVWVRFAMQTDEAYRIVQEWRKAAGNRSAMQRGTVKDGAPMVNLTIAHTYVMQQVEAARLLYRRNAPFCFLMCTDLVSRIFIRDDGSIDDDLLKQVTASVKRVYVCRNHIWLLHKIPDVSDVIAMPTVQATPSPTRPTVKFRNIEAWDTSSETPAPMEYGETETAADRIRQQLHIDRWRDAYKKSNYTKAQLSTFRTTIDGPGLWYTRDGNMVVPQRHRAGVIDLLHLHTNHASGPIVLKAARRRFAWPGMAKDVPARVSQCARCQRMKRRIRHLHGLYKHRRFELPRLHYGLDMKRCKLPSGSVNLLLAIDQFSGFAILMILPTRTTTDLIRALEEQIVYKHGTPVSLFADAAKEFTSAQFEQWCEKRHIKFRPPLPYYPQQNAKTEHFWTRLETAFRNMSDMVAWRQEILRVVFQANISPRATGDSTPFELFYGSPPNTDLANQIALAENVSPRERPDDFTNIMRSATEAQRQMAAADGNAARRMTAEALNEKSRAPPGPLNVGENVLFYAPTKTDRDRPRFSQPEWKHGTIVEANHPAYVIKAGTQKHRRHRTRMKAWPAHMHGAPPHWPDPTTMRLGATTQTQRSATRTAPTTSAPSSVSTEGDTRSDRVKGGTKRAPTPAPSTSATPTRHDNHSAGGTQQAPATAPKTTGAPSRHTAASGDTASASASTSASASQSGGRRQAAAQPLANRKAGGSPNTAPLGSLGKSATVTSTSGPESRVPAAQTVEAVASSGHITTPGMRRASADLTAQAPLDPQAVGAQRKKTTRPVAPTATDPDKPPTKMHKPVRKPDTQSTTPTRRKTSRHNNGGRKSGSKRRSPAAPAPRSTTRSTPNPTARTRRSSREKRPNPKYGTQLQKARRRGRPKRNT